MRKGEGDETNIKRAGGRERETKSKKERLRGGRGGQREKQRVTQTGDRERWRDRDLTGRQRQREVKQKINKTEKRRKKRILTSHSCRHGDTGRAGRSRKETFSQVSCLGQDRQLSQTAFLSSSVFCLLVCICLSHTELVLKPTEIKMGIYIYIYICGFFFSAGPNW